MLLISIDIAAGLSLPRTDMPKITMISTHVVVTNRVFSKEDPWSGMGRRA